mmetsp:Transcript_11636/g.28253  ORF Transcript_11636/g.28253 Transcript_11636/m.28253 type:complete len:264 (-) Transcript_11636:610-1401(-)
MRHHVLTPRNHDGVARLDVALGGLVEVVAREELRERRLLDRVHRGEVEPPRLLRQDQWDARGGCGSFVERWFRIFIDLRPVTRQERRVRLCHERLLVVPLPPAHLEVPQLGLSKEGRGAVVLVVPALVQHVEQPWLQLWRLLVSHLLLLCARPPSSSLIVVILPRPLLTAPPLFGVVVVVVPRPRARLGTPGVVSVLVHPAEAVLDTPDRPPWEEGSDARPALGAVLSHLLVCVGKHLVLLEGPAFDFLALPPMVLSWVIVVV